MSANTQHCSLNLSWSFHKLVILSLIVIGSGQGPLHATDPCASPVPLAPIETWRDPGAHVGDVACFEVVLDNAGILMFDVSTSAATVRARLMSVGTDQTTASGVARLQHSVTSLILAAGPGSYQVRVEAEDPRQPLPAFILSTRFSTGTPRSETDSETEVDPDPFASTPRSETDSETEVDPDPFASTTRSETDSETEVDPDPFASRPIPDIHNLSLAPEPLRSRLAELCRQGETDDHGNSFACATALDWGHQAAGEISNDWGDDGDVFRFRVATLGPVEIRAAGTAELVSELFDRYGQRLERKAGDSRRLVRTLAPGAYFLRLSDRAGGAGRYSLRVGPAAGR